MLDFNAWKAQQDQGSPAPAPTMSFTDWQKSQPATSAYPAPSGAGYADAAMESGPNGDVNWQGLYDPLQNYYWDSTLGGQTVKTRDFLGYGENNQSLDELKAEYYKGLGPGIRDISAPDENPWLNPEYAAQHANYGDWKDVNIQDFASIHGDYWNKGNTNRNGGSPIPIDEIVLSNYDPRVDVGSLKGNNQFDYLFTNNKTGDPNKWLADQGIDLREGTGWRPGDEITTDDPYLRALQETIKPDGKKDLLHRPKHMDADMNVSGDKLQHYLELEKNPLGATAQFLNNYDDVTGNKNSDFYDSEPVQKWGEAMKEANPGFTKGMMQSPVGGLMLGMATGGLGLVGSAAGGITAATGGAISGGAATALGGAAVGAGTGALGAGLAGGDIGKGALSGALGGGLGQYAGGYLNNSISPIIGDNAFSKALSQGLVSGGSSALMGGEFGDGFISGTLNSGVKSVTNDYLSPALNETFSPEMSDMLSKTGGRILGNVVSGRKNDPASLAKMSFSDWLSSSSRP